MRLKLSKIRIILIVILTLLFVVSTFRVIKITSDYKASDDFNAELREQFTNMIDASSIEASAETTKIAVPISIDFDSLKAENDDIVAWIYCPDTPINYPVVQGEDNEQYLRADLKGNYLFSGTIFVDYRNKVIGTDGNFIVYGHNIKNSSMFGTLEKYKEQSYYDAHPILYFLTPEDNYIIELCAGAVVKSDADIYSISPTDSTITDILANSSFVSNIKLVSGEKIITLSTCSYEFNDARYIVIGKLKKI